jgi:large conductance mechanosensitive channel
MWKDFKAFIMRGNVLDLAVAVVIGGAFGGIVKSLVDDVIMPPIGLLLGKVDYGSFVNTVIAFLIVAASVFMIVRVVSRWQTKPVPAAPGTKDCPFCATAIPIAAKRCPNCTSELV